jgi:tetratricopeptide repeat protein
VARGLVAAFDFDFVDYVAVRPYVLPGFIKARGCRFGGWHASRRLSLPAFANRYLGVVLSLWIPGLVATAGELRDVQTEPRLAEPTFTRDIAPIIFRRCSRCHRPGQSGPFSLLSYGDVAKRARQVAEVTASRFMPPWLPEPGHGDFAGERRLAAQEIEQIRLWVAHGAPEGRAEDLPPAPAWSGDWQLGKPDLVVEVPEAYSLPAEGKDVYRNFVVPIPIDSKRFVRGVEFRPGNYKVVHHAFVEVDETRVSRRLAEHQRPPGFDGMDLPEGAHTPGGQLLGWQPGREPAFSPPGLAWELEKGTDLVLQLHLHPSGKPETVRPQVGFYFTDQRPTNMAYRVKLENWKIDVPPGAADYHVKQSYVLPIDVVLLRILPHAHYLGKEMQVYAVLPDGTRKWLIHIPAWDFNWQGDYAYEDPIELPKGTRLAMDFSFDNSSANPRNPNQPPKRVKYGLQSTDEMAACSLQVLPKQAGQRNELAKDFQRYYARASLDYGEFLLKSDPRDAVAHTKMARALIGLGDLAAAQQHLGDAIRANPDFDKAYYDLGMIWLNQNRLKEAEAAFKGVVRLNPGDAQAYGNLGIICLRKGRLDQAEQYFRDAIRLNPDDTVAQQNLEALLRSRSQEKK